MNQTLDEHEIRDAVEQLAAGAATAPLPGPAILAAGARRRVRRRVGAAGGLALAATLAVSVTWSAASGGSSAGPAAGPATTTNAFTEQLGHTLAEVLPGAKVTASMFADTDPAARHERLDVFPLRITYHGHVSDAFLTLRAFTPGKGALGQPAAILCHGDLIPPSTRSGCVSKDLADGGTVHAEVQKGSGAWTPAWADLGAGDSPLTIVEGDVDLARSGAWAMVQVHGGAEANGSTLTPPAVSAALGDPRFTAFLSDFAAHPERDPYGPPAPDHGTVVASGSVGTHRWTLSFGLVSRTAPHDITQVLTNCDYWDYTVDGVSTGPDPEYACGPSNSKNDNPPPTDKSQPYPANRLYAGGYTPTSIIGSILTSTVPRGTATVEASFDDGSPKITTKVFTIRGDVPYFVLVKADSASPGWKTATVKCLAANGNVLGELYFTAPTSTAPPTK
ncbi:hypothetical protein ABH935_004502 [Catenulispora sp. GAS73]|uniref:hypothetical protein n=1 Tax=Catenulispora sp. GAS73 TaxID=3156269 RepID=UPI003517933F